MSSRHDLDACPAARALGVLGDAWSLLIVREAFAGATRYREFRSRLGLSDHTLSRRLQSLVADGVLARSPEAEGRREVYSLTSAGRDLGPVLVALGVWGTRWRPIEGPNAPLPPALRRRG